MKKLSNLYQTVNTAQPGAINWLDLVRKSTRARTIRRANRIIMKDMDHKINKMRRQFKNIMAESGYFPYDSDKILEQAKKEMGDKAFTMTFTSGKTKFVKTFDIFRHWKQLRNWFNIPVIGTQDAYMNNPARLNDLLTANERDIFSILKVTFEEVAGGCNKHKSHEKEIKGRYYNFQVFNPVSKDNNCGLKCIEHLMIKKMDVKNLRKQYNLPSGQKLTPDELIMIHKDLLPNRKLYIIDHYSINYNKDVDIILYHNEHYYVVTNAERIIYDNEKKTKRGNLFWDIEARVTDDYVPVTIEGKESKSYLLKDTITRTYHKRYRSKLWEDNLFENDGVSSVRKFINWLQDETNAGRSYNCIAHNCSRFDLYFLVAELTKEELLNCDMKLRGHAIIQLTLNGHRFTDSYCFLTKSLKDLCDDFKVDKGKLTEFDLNGTTITNEQLCFYKPKLSFNDFMNLKKTDPKFWKLYTNYCLRDCESLAEIWMSFKTSITNVMTKMNVRLLRHCSLNTSVTIGGLAMKILRKLNEFDPRAYNKMAQFTDNDIDKNDFLRKCVVGGISHCHKPGKHHYSVSGFDICSQYPCCAVSMLIPCGKSIWINKNYYSSKLYGWWKIKDLVFGDKTKDFKPVSTRSDNGILNWNTGSSIEEAYLDTWTIEYLKEHYDLKSFTVEKALVSSQNMRSYELMGTYVNTLFKEKEHQDQLKKKGEEYNDAYRSTIKLFLNAITGKFIENPAKHQSLLFTSDEMNKNIGGVNVKRESDVKINEWLPVGLMIYSYSKRLLFEYIRMLPKDSNDIIHVETDGLYLPTKYNEEFSKNIEKYEGKYPVKFGDKLGNLKLEKSSLEDKVSCFNGKKFYLMNAYEKYDTQKNIMECMKIKGVPMKSTDKSGNTSYIVNEQVYIDYANGIDQKFEFNTLSKSLFGDKNHDKPIVSCHKMSRTLKAKGILPDYFNISL